MSNEVPKNEKKNTRSRTQFLFDLHLTDQRLLCDECLFKVSLKTTRSESHGYESRGIAKNIKKPELFWLKKRVKNENCFYKIGQMHQEKMKTRKK